MQQPSPAHAHGPTQAQGPTHAQGPAHAQSHGPAATLTLDELAAWLPLLSEEEQAARATTRRFVQTACMPRIRQDYDDGVFHRGWVAELGRLGLLGAPLQGYGCAGLSAVAYGLACLELEACDSGLRSFVSVQTSLVMYAIWRFGSEAQKRTYLPSLASGERIGCFGLTEPSSGSDPGNMATRGVRDGDDWLLSGSKLWITNAQIADVAILWGRTGDSPGSVRGWIVERGTAGFAAHDIPHKLSMRASHTGGLTLQDVRVAESARLPLAEGLKAPLACLDNARFGVAFGVLGAAQFCLERAIAYVQDRRQFGGPIAAKQLVQAPLAELASRWVQAALLSLHYGRLKDQGNLQPAQVSLLKRNNCRMALDAARTARELLGANGVSGAYDVMRHASNLESVLTYEGTEQIHTLVLGRALTGASAF